MRIGTRWYPADLQTAQTSANGVRPSFRHTSSRSDSSAEHRPKWLNDTSRLAPSYKTRCNSLQFPCRVRGWPYDSAPPKLPQSLGVWGCCRKHEEMSNTQASCNNVLATPPTTGTKLALFVDATASSSSRAGARLARDGLAASALAAAASASDVAPRSPIARTSGTGGRHRRNRR